MDPVGATVRRFPLVPRPRPACSALDARVGELCALADTAQQTGSRATASAVFNQAALLASDVGRSRRGRRRQVGSSSCSRRRLWGSPRCCPDNRLCHLRP